MTQSMPFEDTAGDANSPEKSKTSSTHDDKVEEFDCRKYRPFEVTVFIDIRNVKGHLVKVIYI